ncbi:MAG: hypothetical protein FWG18_01120 [Alphaproteobacteria bacterium]|nr:hypothetical protein [Alphaproteobacteria bacterium]
MKIDICVFGRPNGADFSDCDKNNSELFEDYADELRATGKPQTYGTYLDHVGNIVYVFVASQNVVGFDDNKDSYFGISFAINQGMFKEENSLSKFFDFLMKHIISNGVLFEQLANGDIKYRVAGFKDARAEIDQIKTNVIRHNLEKNLRDEIVPLPQAAPNVSVKVPLIAGNPVFNNRFRQYSLMSISQEYKMPMDLYTLDRLLRIFRVNPTERTYKNAQQVFHNIVGDQYTINAADSSLIKKLNEFYAVFSDEKNKFYKPEYQADIDKSHSMIANLVEQMKPKTAPAPQPVAAPVVAPPPQAEQYKTAGRKIKPQNSLKRRIHSMFGWRNK